MTRQQFLAQLAQFDQNQADFRRVLEKSRAVHLAAVEARTGRYEQMRHGIGESVSKSELEAINAMLKARRGGF